jgi:hypothetical protein
MITNNYDYIAELFVDTNTGMYDLYLTTFNGNINVLNLRTFICERRHACRLDLVVAEIYNDTKWVGSISQINDILNPFSIREGDILFYIPESDLQGLLKVPENISSVVASAKNDLIKNLKKKKPDGLRKNYTDNRGNDKLPPSVLPESAPQVVIANNKIRIAPNLFTNPLTQPTPEDTTSPIPNAPTASEDDIQRVLVRRYIKLANE